MDLPSRLANWQVFLPPVLQSDQRRRKVPALLGQPIVVAERFQRVWVLFQNSLLDQPLQPVRQQVSGDPEAGLELVKP